MPNYLPYPQIDWTAEKVQAFEEIFAAAQATGPGAWIDYQLPYPKYEFLCYLVERKAALVHGSNNAEINVFTPRQQTDYMGRVISAVFAASDGIWPMYFACIDRANYRGSLRNGCFWRSDPDGVQRKYYRFSINQDLLAGNPWIPGTIYILPRAPFEQVKDENGDPLEEWACPHEVQPLARLRIEPQDFPFLGQVEGHDDGLVALLPDMLTTYLRLENLEDGFALAYGWDKPGWQVICDFARLLRDMGPIGIEIQVLPEPEPDGTLLWLRMHGPQPFVDQFAAAVQAFPR